MARRGRTTQTGTTKADADKDFAGSAVEGEKAVDAPAQDVPEAVPAEAAADKDFAGSAVEGEKAVDQAPDAPEAVPAEAAEKAVVTCEDVLKRLRAQGRPL